MLSEFDHRRLGQELDLFHFQDEAPGAAFWHPRGLAIVRELEELVRRATRADGYVEVRSPQVMARAIWQASGHWDVFSSGMIRLEDEDEPAALKPVSCPAHLEIVRRASPSWRDLPMRIAELGIVHRNERRGSLHGLFRLRQFQQDDGHVFCAEEHVEAEIARFLSRVRRLYAVLGFDHVEVALSLRPENRHGDDALWDRAESALERAVCGAGFPCNIQPGQGAFYGPKIELVLHDRADRPWQCGTIQLDFVLPERFDVRYVDRKGERAPIVMLHRAMLGSFERFVGILLEHHEGKLPAWLAPESVRVLPISSAHAAYASEVVRALQGVRASVDRGDAPLARRIVAAHADRIPIVAVVGKREAENRSVVLREHDGQRELSLVDAASMLAKKCAPPELS
jgi:threonyl-tRNA synthetase